MNKNKKVELAKEFDEKIEKQVRELTGLIIYFILFSNVDPRSESAYIFLALAQDSLYDLISSGQDIKGRRLYVIALACILGLMKLSQKELMVKGAPDVMKIATAAQWMEWQERQKLPHSIWEKLGIKRQGEKEDKEREKRIECNKNLLTEFFHSENKGMK